MTVRELRGYGDEARRAVACCRLGTAARRPTTRPPPTTGRQPAASTATRQPVELLAAAFAGFLPAMDDNLPGLLDDVDTEFLHDFRVAVRRTRATLKLGRPALPDGVRSRWEPAFKWLGDLTTPVRDLDVYELDLPTMAGWLVAADAADLRPFATHLRRRRSAERRVLVRGLRSARFERLLSDWADALAAARRRRPTGDDAAHRRGSSPTEASAGRARRVVRGGAAVTADSPAEALHALRKRVQGAALRAGGVRAGASTTADRKRAVADLKELQDVLGRFQDAEVQRQALRGFAEEMMADGTARRGGARDGRADRPPGRRAGPGPRGVRRRVRAVRPPGQRRAGSARLGGSPMKVLATYNIKGGVGKTSTAVNLAYLAAREGRRTLLWDLDPQAAATFLFRVRPRVKGGGRGLVTRQRPIEAALKATDFEGLDLLPADFSYRNMDLELDDTKKRTRRLRPAAAAARPATTTSSSSTARRASPWCRRTCCTPPTRCWSR